MGLVHAFVFDPVGGAAVEPLTQSMSRYGILLEYGALTSEPTPFPLFTVIGKSLTLKGYSEGAAFSESTIWREWRSCRGRASRCATL